MRFEDRIQVNLWELTDAFFETIVAYGFCKPSGFSGPGCVLMISEAGKSYQFHGSELDKRNYYMEWSDLFPVLKETKSSKWKFVKNTWCDKVYVRADIYDTFMENRATQGRGIGYEDHKWEEACIKALLLLHATTEKEIEDINWSHELRTPLYEKGDLVTFYFQNGKGRMRCDGVVSGRDIYRIRGKIEEITYDICGPNYINLKKDYLYKHIDENDLMEAVGQMRVVSGFSGIGNEEIISKLVDVKPEKYMVYKPLIHRNAETGEKNIILSRKVFKHCFQGKGIIIDTTVQGTMMLREKHPSIFSFFILPQSFEELLNKVCVGESRANVCKKLHQCLIEIECVDQFNYLLINDGSDYIPNFMDLLFSPVCRKAWGANEKEKKLLTEIKEGIIRYLEENEAYADA